MSVYSYDIPKDCCAHQARSIDDQLNDKVYHYLRSLPSSQTQMLQHMIQSYISLLVAAIRPAVRSGLVWPGIAYLPV